MSEGKLLAAKGTGAVGRINERLIGKRQEFIVERVVQASAEIAGCPSKRSAQVRTADVTDEQRVSCKNGHGRENGMGFGGVFMKIEDQYRDGLDGVPRGFENFKAQSREVEPVPVLHSLKTVLRLGAGAQMDCRAASVAQFQVSGDEVRVKMGEEDVADFEAERRGVGQVLLDVALGIDNDGRRTGLVPEQIGRVS